MGLSTVVYLLLNLHDFNTLNSFKVSLFNEHSDHSLLMFSLICRPLVDGNNTHEENNEENNENKIHKCSIRLGASVTRTRPNTYYADKSKRLNKQWFNASC